MLPIIQANLISAALRAMERAEHGPEKDPPQGKDRPYPAALDLEGSTTRIYRADVARTQVTSSPPPDVCLGTQLDCLL